MNNIVPVDFGSILRVSAELVASSYQRLPLNYFEGKNAGTYLFNNITRLIETFPPSPASDPAAVREVISRQVLSHEMASLYLGVPWCEQICSFCNFAYSTSKSDEERKAYLDLILAELMLLNQCGLANRPINSVYFGGGTPTVLSDELFDYYLASVLSAVNLMPGASITCEATVSTLTRQKLDLMRRNGITRLSMGIQSLDDNVREQAKLLCSGAEVVEVVGMAREYFDMFNVDLIYGYPYQSHESWFDTVMRVAELNLPSITIYRLEVKERTTNLKLFRQESAAFMDELTARQQYFIARLVFTSWGYVEQPLGWWVRSDRHEGSHTWKQHMAGWARAIPYFGLGQGAFSFCAGAYWENHKVQRLWQDNVARSAFPVASLHTLDSRVPLLNRIIRILRTAQGIDLSAVESELAVFKLYEPFAELLDRHADWGLLERNGPEYTLNDAGRSLIHWMLDEIVRLPMGCVV